MTRYAGLDAALTDIGAEILRHKRTHGWKVTGPGDWANDREIPSVLMLITTEVAEAMEAFRADDLENFVEELADIVLRTVGLAHGMQIDLAAASIAKMAKNRHRPLKHGGKRL
jgi:NTP pyrophosphatase (non-canonical NTP hydrolase)